MSDRPAILVTGGAGYIGSHCCRALAASGFHPIAFDNLSTGHRSFVSGPLVVGDLLDKAALGCVFAQHDVSIRTAEQHGLGPEARLVFITHDAREADVQATLADLRLLDVVRRVGGVLRVVGA